MSDTTFPAREHSPDEPPDDPVIRLFTVRDGVSRGDLDYLLTRIRRDTSRKPYTRTQQTFPPPWDDSAAASTQTGPKAPPRARRSD